MNIEYIIYDMHSASPTGKWRIQDENGIIKLYIEMVYIIRDYVKTNKIVDLRYGFLWLRKRKEFAWEYCDVERTMFVGEDHISYSIKYPEQTCA